MTDTPHLSVTEYVVLGLLAEGRRHGFALAKELDTGSDVGRVLTVRRPLVYRALDRLTEAGYTEPVITERGKGPRRVIHRITDAGRARLEEWLNEPVEHVRDLRIELIVKLTLLSRSGHSPFELVRKQRAALAPTLTALDDADSDEADHVELWRRHNATAAAAFLEELEHIHGRA
jgi:DNA-binding PadR family transcriptional regulator